MRPLAAAAALLGLGAAPAPDPDAALFTGADPAALVVDGRVWLYPTGDDKLEAWAQGPDRRWRPQGLLLRRGDVRWIGADRAPRHGLWAPHMIAANGRHYLYFSVGPQEPTPSRLGVAVCDGPAGPCRDSGRPLLDGQDSDDFRGAPSGACADATYPTGSGRFRFEAIDPFVFHDAERNRHLLFAGGSNGSTLRAWELRPDMVTLAREVPVDQPPCFTEAPWMHRAGGRYHLTYSSGSFNRISYSVRHASAPTPTGPWTYHGALTRSGKRWKGPGHHSIVPDPAGGGWLFFYHRWENQPGDGPYIGRRRVALARIAAAADGAIAPVPMR